jgi:hypothetical protein
MLTDVNVLTGLVALFAVTLAYIVGRRRGYLSGYNEGYRDCGRFRDQLTEIVERHVAARAQVGAK